MAYQNVSTPRFYVSILQWLKSLGQLTINPDQTNFTEANNIPDDTGYNNLQLWFTMTPEGECGEECSYAGEMLVSQAWFECDDAGAASSADNPAAFLLFSGM